MLLNSSLRLLDDQFKHRTLSRRLLLLTLKNPFFEFTLARVRCRARVTNSLTSRAVAANVPRQSAVAFGFWNSHQTRQTQWSELLTNSQPLFFICLSRERASFCRLLYGGTPTALLDQHHLPCLMEASGRQLVEVRAAGWETVRIK